VDGGAHTLPVRLEKHSFAVDSKKGFDKTGDLVDKFIADIWSDMSNLKCEYGTRLVLAFDDRDNRNVKDAIYRENQKKDIKEQKKDPDFWAIVEKATNSDRELEDFATSACRPGLLVLGEMRALRPGLVTFAEVIEIERPDLPSVKAARDGLKIILTRHLCRDTNEYLLREKDGLIEYGRKAKTPSEQAHMEITSKKPQSAANMISRETLFAHFYVYGLVGAGFEAVRRTGIMPSLNFRWLRLYDKPFWYFIENPGMPLAFQENVGASEHYMAERTANIRLSKPHIETSIEGIRAEAEKYLVPEKITRITETYGTHAVRGVMKGGVFGWSRRHCRRPYEVDTLGPDTGSPRRPARGPPRSKRRLRTGPTMSLSRERKR